MAPSAEPSDSAEAAAVPKAEAADSAEANAGDSAEVAAAPKAEAKARGVAATAAAPEAKAKAEQAAAPKAAGTTEKARAGTGVGLKASLGLAGLCLISVGGLVLRSRGPDLSKLTLEELDGLQRTTAASWHENEHCHRLFQYAADNDISVWRLSPADGGSFGYCMAAPAQEWVDRRIKKDKLLQNVAVTWKMFDRMAEGSPPERYVPGGMATDDGGGDSCTFIRGLPVPEVTWPPTSDGAAHAAMRSDGVLLLRRVIADAGLISSGQRYLLQRGVRPEGKITEYVHSTQHRHHLLLDPDESPIIKEIYASLVGVAGHVLLPLVGSLGTIVEFACYITNPGAEQQNLHADSRHQVDGRDPWARGTQAPVYSIFLFLSDVDTVEMGPLQVIPRSHVLSDIRHKMTALERSCVDGAGCGEGSLCPVRAGDAAVYDSTVGHRGRENDSNRSRIVVYLSVMGVGTIPVGPTWGAGNWMLDPPRRLGRELKAAGKVEL